MAGPNPYGAAGADIRHFTAPKGLQSVVEHFVEGSGVEAPHVGMSFDVVLVRKCLVLVFSFSACTDILFAHSFAEKGNGVVLR